MFNSELLSALMAWSFLPKSRFQFLIGFPYLIIRSDRCMEPLNSYLRRPNFVFVDGSTEFKSRLKTGSSDYALSGRQMSGYCTHFSHPPLDVLLIFKFVYRNFKRKIWNNMMPVHAKSTFYFPIQYFIRVYYFILVATFGVEAGTFWTPG